jgi:UDP-2-acetamido-2,6-beta-L-arabino-hexul-4-ose reductase
VFGKWCRPDYNSVVATFCHRISNALEINIHDRASKLTLVYIDDLISSFLRTLANPGQGCNQVEVKESYSINVGELADILRGFKQSRYTLESGNVGSGLCRALYATYLSYLSPDNFSYELKANVDERGKFVEVLKTPDSGQFSFFTAKPCVTRGGHYHHTKNEKFLVVRGKALFKFRHLVTNETHQVTTSAETPEIVETIPGWVHDITNISEEELVVMLWANEVFDENKPDTVGAAVDG